MQKAKVIGKTSFDNVVKLDVEYSSFAYLSLISFLKDLNFRDSELIN